MRQGYMDSLYKIVRVHEVENEQTYNDFIYADVG